MSTFSWTIVDTGDFTGNGRADILLHRPATNEFAAYEPGFRNYGTAGDGWELA